MRFTRAGFIGLDFYDLEFIGADFHDPEFIGVDSQDEQFMANGWEIQSIFIDTAFLVADLAQIRIPHNLRFIDIGSFSAKNHHRYRFSLIHARQFYSVSPMFRDHRFAKQN